MRPELASPTFPEVGALAQELGAGLGILHKRDIQAASRILPSVRGGPWGTAEVRIGDDTAAIPDGDGYLLLALAIVDALFAGSAQAAGPLLRGMADAAERFAVPIVGGHTNLHSPYPALAAAVLGRARRLLTSFAARPGDDLVVAVDLRGRMHPRHAFWNASDDAPPARLRADYALLPRIAEEGLATAAKDVSMGGIAGTALMLCEASRVGATLFLDAVPRPPDVPLHLSWARWLQAFPSFGFLLAVPPSGSARLCAAFAERDIAAAVIGRCDDGRRLSIVSSAGGARSAGGAGGASAEIWDLAAAPLTGFDGRERSP